MKATNIAAAVCAACIVCFTSDALASQSLFNFRTTPANVVAGVPFTVDADSNICYVLFVGTHQGINYGGVSIAANTIQVRYGYYQTPTCDSPTGVISQNVPGLPAGSYEVQAILVPLVPGGPEFIDDTFALRVAQSTAATHTIPSLGWLSAVLCSLLVVASGLALGMFRKGVAEDR